MLAFILNLILVFFIKVFDNILGTSKTILIQKNKGLIASLTVVISQIIFYKLINIVDSSNGDIMIYTIALASGIGTFLALIISNKFSKDRTYVNVILNDNKKAMVELRNFLKEHHITNLTTIGYTKNWKKSLAITAYAETKEQSKLIDKFIRESNVKYKRIVDMK